MYGKPPRGRAGTAGDRDVADGERVLPHDKAYDFFPVTYKGILSKEHESIVKEKLPEFYKNSGSDFSAALFLFLNLCP